MAELASAAVIARRLADALEAAGIPYALGGALAYGLHAPPRATNDVDLNVFVEPVALEPVFETLEGAGAQIDRTVAARSAVERGDFIASVDGMRVDLFVPSIELSDAAATRVITATLLGRPVTALSAEDLTLFKLLFFRGKDIVDIERLVAFRLETLDRAYIREWLVRMVGDDDVRVLEWDRITSSS